MKRVQKRTDPQLITLELKVAKLEFENTKRPSPAMQKLLDAAMKELSEYKKRS